jgi:hypothetical protein
LNMYWYTGIHHQPSSTIINHQSIRASNLQNEQFRPQNHKFHQLVASYRKRRFIYLNIFRAKLRPHSTKNKRNSNHSSTATTHHVNESQPSPGGTTHTHITSSYWELTHTHTHSLTHKHLLTLTHTHTLTHTTLINTESIEDRHNSPLTHFNAPASGQLPT